MRTINKEVQLSLPSKEGTTIQAEISILYRVREDKLHEILQNAGEDYEATLILTTFRSAAADVSARHFAKDMHSTERTNIGNEIAELMNERLYHRGFEIEGVMLKSIVLPPGLARSIEEKLQAEQDAQRMQFVLQREELEARRRIVEAEGIRDSQKIISAGLMQNALQWRSIEAFRELANSPNTKIIITDGRTPIFITDDKK
ncbi:MAG: prohibitin family protein [Leptospiraceae bacterium]|nr:prohibitin family protein [Leptospiraceae bacterium]